MLELPKTAVLAFDESGAVEIHADATTAAIAYEGIDVESGVVSFFDADGHGLDAHFITPNEHGSSLGFLKWVKSGTYTLVLAAEPEKPIALAFSEAVALEKNEWFETLDALMAHLRSRGVVVDFSP